MANHFIQSNKIKGVDLVKKTGTKTFALTGREREVQVLLTNGMSNKMIAQELDICEGTVKIHVKNLMRKLHARSRLEVAVIAMRGEMDTELV